MRLPALLRDLPKRIRRTFAQSSAGRRDELVPRLFVRPLEDRRVLSAQALPLQEAMHGLSLVASSRNASGQDAPLQIVQHGSKFDISISANDQGSPATIRLEGLDTHTAADVVIHANPGDTLDLAGLIDLHGGRLTVTGGSIQLEGTVKSLGGSVNLDAGQGTLLVSGTIDVSNAAAGHVGGQVELLGNQVDLTAAARVDASGGAGGGTILVGGDNHGANPLVHDATSVEIAQGAVIQANALASGSGGKVVVWADNSTVFAGTILARGGSSAGDGGAAEVSGKEFLAVTGHADLTAAHGHAGTLLLDPGSVTIEHEAAGNTPPNGTFSVFFDDWINGQLGAGSLIISTGNSTDALPENLVVNGTADAGGAANITWATTNTLTLIGSNSVNLHAGSVINNTSTTTGGLNLQGGSVTLNGTITAASASITATGAITGGAAATDIDTSAANGAITLSGTSLGAGGNPLELSPGTGSLSFTASSGDIYVDLSAGNLSTSKITTLSAAGNGVTIALSTTNGTITLDSVAGFNPNTNNDNFQLTTAGVTKNIAFSGATTLTAASANLTATGAVTSGTAATDIDTSAANGAISLSAANGVGTTVNPFSVLAAGGTVSATTTAAGGDIYLTAAGPMNLGAVSTAGGSAQTVNASTTGAGSNLTLVASSTTNDNWTLNATGNIAFSGATTLTAASANLTAAGAITSGTAATDIDTSAANGAIALSAANGVGTTVNPFSVLAAGGTVSATTTAAGGDIYLTAAGPMNLGAVSTAGGSAQSVNVATTGAGSDLTLVASSTTNDDWTLNATGSIAFSGATTLTAASANLTATGAITSGTAATDIDTSTANGTITLSGTSLGASGNSMELSPGSGSLSLTASSGDVYVDLSAGNLSTSKITTLSAAGNGVTIALSTTNGTITLDSVAGFNVNTQNDNFQLKTGGVTMDIAFSGATTLTAASASLSATGAITSGTAATDIDTSAANGTIALSSANGIGTTVNPFSVLAAGGTVSATTTASGANGDVYLTAAGPMNLGAVSTAAGSTQTVNVATTGAGSNLTLVASSATNDDWTLNATGNIAFSGATTLTAASANLTATGAITSGTAATDIDTSTVNGTITLSGTGLGASGNSMELSPGTGSLSLAASSGDVYVDLSAGNLSTSKITTLSAAGNGVTIALSTTNGTITVDSVAGFNANTQDDNFQLTTAGVTKNIAFSGATTLTAASANLTATGAITSGTAATDIDTSTANGPITLNGASLGASGNSLEVNPGTSSLSLTAGSGDIYVDLSAGDLSTSKITTLSAAGNGVTIALSTTNGTITVDSVAGFNANTQNDNFALTTGGSADIAFSGATTLTAASANLTATGAITSGTAVTDIDTSAANGAIVLSAANGVGAAGNPFSVLAAGGTVSAATTAAGGDIYLTAAGPMNLGAVSTAGGSAQTVNASTTGAGSNLKLVASSTTNDNWTLNATGSIAFSGATTLTAASANLTAAGAITSGTAATDIDTSTANGTITLSGTSLGASGNSLELSPGTGSLSLTAASSDIYVDLSAGNLSTTKITTLSAAGNGVTIALSTTNGTITVDSVAGFNANTQDDNFHLTTAGVTKNIAFSGATTLAAASANLTATGAITSGTAATDIDTSAANGPITLSSASLGASGNSLEVNPGTSSLSLTAGSGDIYVDLSAGNLSTSKITTLSAAGNGVTIALSTTNGTITVDSVTGFNANTQDDTFQLTAAGTTKNIAFSGATTLTAAGANLAATGAITSGTAATDIDTSAANGAITLSGTSLGASGNPMELSPGTGSLSLTATSSDIYVDLSAGNLSTSKITTLSAAGNGATIALSTTNGTITVDSVAGFNANTQNDNFHLTTAGATKNIVFSGATTLTAASANLTATGAITSGTAATDIDTSAANGAIILNGASLGASGNFLEVNPGTSSLSLTAGSGDIYVDLSAGDLLTSVITTLSAAGNGVTIALSTTNGTITVDSVAGFNVNTQNDNFQLKTGVATKDIAFSGATTLTAAGASLSATGAITSGTAATDIDTSAANGAIALSGANGIGTTVNPFSVLAASGTVSATTAAAGGDIYLTAAGPMNLGAVSTAAGSAQTVNASTTGAGSNLTLVASSTTNDDWALNATGSIAFSGATTLTAASANLTATGAITSGTAATDIDTSAANGPITLGGTSLGASGNSLELSPGSGSLSLTATSSDIYVDLSAGNLSTNKITTLSAAGNGVTVALSTTNGTITVDSVAGFNANTQDDNFHLTSAGVTENIAFSGATTLTAASANLTATGAITSGTAATDIDTSAANGPITLNGASLGASGNFLEVNPGTSSLSLTAGSGDIYVDLSAGNLSTSKITTLSAAGNGVTIALSTTNGTITVDSVAGFNANTQNDNFQLTTSGAAKDIAFSGATTLTAAGANLTATGAITSGTAVTDIDTSAANGAISLSAANGIGTTVNPFSVLAGGGTVSATTTAAGGDIYLTAAGPMNLGAVSTAGGSAQTVNASTTGAGSNLTLVASSTTNDNWTLNATGSIAFSGATTLTAASANLTAAGAIASGTAATDIDTSAANGAITLSGTSLGASGNPMELSPGTGSLSLTASSGGIFVDLAAGDLSTSEITTLSAAGNGVTIALSTANGAITVDSLAGFNANTQNDNFALTTGGTAKDIAFSGSTTLTAAGANLTATGAVTSGTAVTDINTSAANGAITLSGTSLGANGNFLELSPGTGSLNFTANSGGIFVDLSAGDLLTSKIGTLSAAGNGVTIALSTTDGTITLDSVAGFNANTQNDNFQLTTGGATKNIAFSGATTLTAASANLAATGAITSGTAATDIDTSAANGAITLSGTSLGAGGNPMELSPGTGSLSLTAASSDIYVDLSAGNLSTSKIMTLSAAGNGVTIALSTTNGTITVDSVAGFNANTQNDNLHLTTAGVTKNIAFSGATTLTAASANLTATGAITSGTAATDIDTSAANGPITLSGASLGASGNPLELSPGTALLSLAASSGDIHVDLSAGTLSTSKITTLSAAGNGVTIALSTTNGTITVDSVAGFNANTQNDNFQLTTSGAAKDIAFSGVTTLTAAGASLSATGAITSGTAATDINTSAANGPITLSGANGVGTLANPFSVLAAGGTVTTTTTAAGASGDIYLTAAGSMNLGVVSTDSASAQTVNVGTTGAGSNLTLVASSTTDDNWTVNAAANIAFNDPVTVTTGGASLTAGGSISSNKTAGNSSRDIIASGGGLTLDAASGIGSASKSLQITATSLGATISGSGDLFIDNSSSNAVTVHDISTNDGKIVLSQTGGGSLTIVGTVQSTAVHDITITASADFTVAATSAIQSGSGSNGIQDFLGVTLEGTVNAGTGTKITLHGGSPDTIIASPLTLGSGTLSAVRDVIIKAVVTTTAGNTLIQADTNGTGIGGVWIQSTGSIKATGGDVTLHGSDVWATASGTPDSIRIDASSTVVTNQIEASGNIQLTNNPAAPANALILVNDPAAAGGTTTTSLKGTKVTFDNAVNGGGNALAIVGNAVFNASVTNLSALDISGATALNVAGSTTATPSVQSSGSQTYHGAVELQQDTVLTSTTSGNIDFVGTVDSKSGTSDALTVNTAGTTTFGGQVGNSRALTSLTTDAAGTTAVNGGAVYADTQDYKDAVTLGTDTVFAKDNTNASATSVNFEQTLDGNVAVAVDAVTTTFGGKVGNATALKSLTTDAAGTTAINGGAVYADTQDYRDAVTPGTDTVFAKDNTNASATSVNFEQTLDGNVAVAVDAVTTTFGGKVGNATALKSLTTDLAGTTAINGGAVYADGQDYKDAVTLGSDAVFAKDNTNASATSVNFEQTLDGNVAVTVEAIATTFGGKVGNATALKSLTTDATGTTAINGGAVYADTQDYKDAVTLGTDTVFAKDNANASATSVNFEQTLDGNVAVFLDAVTTTFGGKVGNTTALKSLTTDAAGTTAVNGGAVYADTQDYKDAVTLGGDAVFAKDNTSISATSVNFEQTLDGNVIVIVDAVTTTFGGKVGNATALKSLTTDLAGTTAINGGAVYADTQDYKDAVTLGTDTVFAKDNTNASATSVNFEQTLDGNVAVAVDAVTTTFGGQVGNTIALKSLTTDAAGTTAVDGGGVKSTGLQDYKDAVTAGAASTSFQSTGGGAIGFESTLDGGSAVTVNTAGTITFSGLVGSNTALTSLTTEGGGVTAVNGGGVKSTGLQDYKDAVSIVGGASTSFQSTGSGAISFESTLDAQHVLTVDAGGDVSFTGIVKNLRNTTLTSRAGSVAFQSDVYSDGSVAPSSLTITAAQSVTFNGNVGTSDPNLGTLQYAFSTIKATAGNGTITIAPNKVLATTKDTVANTSGHDINAAVTFKPPLLKVDLVPATQVITATDLLQEVSGTIGLAANPADGNEWARSLDILVQWPDGTTSMATAVNYQQSVAYNYSMTDPYLTKDVGQPPLDVNATINNTANVFANQTAQQNIRFAFQHKYADIGALVAIQGNYVTANITVTNSGTIQLVAGKSSLDAVTLPSTTGKGEGLQGGQKSIDFSPPTLVEFIKTESAPLLANTTTYVASTRFEEPVLHEKVEEGRRQIVIFKVDAEGHEQEISELRDEPDRLAALLDKLKRGAYPNGRYRVYQVEGGKQGTEQVRRFLQEHYKAGKTLGDPVHEPGPGSNPIDPIKNDGIGFQAPGTVPANGTPATAAVRVGSAIPGQPSPSSGGESRRTYSKTPLPASAAADEHNPARMSYAALRCSAAGVALVAIAGVEAGCQRTSWTRRVEQALADSRERSFSQVARLGRRLRAKK